jgi:signal peptidase I
MEPTLRKNDVLAAARFTSLTYEPADGDVVVFLPPILTSAPFIKRVVGVPGDSLRITDGTLYRNGRVVREPFTKAKTDYELAIEKSGIYVDGSRLDEIDANIPPTKDWQQPDRIPTGCYIVLGDNRNDSEDSHIFGCAQRSGGFYSGPLAGRNASGFQLVIGILAPPQRFGAIASGGTATEK